MQWWSPLALLATFFLLPPVVSAQTPPTRAFGTVSIDGQPALPGTKVEALIGDQVCGEGEVRRVSDAIPRGYVVDVLSASQTPGCGTDGSRIIFRVGGRQANETAEFRTGAFLRHDLTVSGQVSTPTPGPTPPPFGPPAATATGTVTPAASPGAGTATTPSGAPSPRATATAPSTEHGNGSDDGGNSGALIGGLAAIAVLAAAGAGYYLYRRRAQ